MKRYLNLDKLVFLYPCLFAANTILVLTFNNIANITASEIYLSFLTFILLTIALLFIIGLITRDAHRTGYLVFVLMFWGSYFGVFYSLIMNAIGYEKNIWSLLGAFGIWSVFWAFIGSKSIWKRIKRPQTITSFLTILAFVVVFFDVYKLQQFRAGTILPDQYKDFYPEITQFQITEKPDIYYIILDGYGRADVLSEIYNYENERFINILKQLGFYIADTSYSNYIQTALSLSSTLNMDYLPDFPIYSNDTSPLYYFIKLSRVRRFLEDAGYSFYSFQSPYSVTNLTDADVYYVSEAQIGVRNLLGLLLTNSIGAVAVETGVLQPPLAKFSDQQKIVYRNLEALPGVALQPGPKFVFLHLIIPHPPFFFDRLGPVTPDAAYILSDGPTYPGTTEEYLQSYQEQLEYTNAILSDSLEQLVENSKEGTIIILQGDHGPGALFSEDIDETCLKERFGILNAYYVPAEMKSLLYPGISPVNTFRLILDSLFDTNLGLLEDRMYFSNFEHRYDFIDVKDRIDQPCTIR